MPTRRPLLSLSRVVSLAGMLILSLPLRADEWRSAPHPDAPPVNQLKISGNACGPGALLASFRCGDERWRGALKLVPEPDDRRQLSRWIRTYGLRPSLSLKGRTRWTNSGINVDDLVAAANDMTRTLMLPQLAQDGLFIQGREDVPALVRRLHGRLSSSLAKGVPPVLSLRRFTLREGRWVPIQGHFVTVIGVPAKLKRGEGAFAFDYLDPWGGKRARGVLQVPVRPLLPAADGRPTCLEASVPDANIGRKEVRKGEVTAVVPAAVIGRW